MALDLTFITLVGRHDVPSLLQLLAHHGLLGRAVGTAAVVAPYLRPGSLQTRLLGRGNDRERTLFDDAAVAQHCGRVPQHRTDGPFAVQCRPSAGAGWHSPSGSDVSRRRLPFRGTPRSPRAAAARYELVDQGATALGVVEKRGMTAWDDLEARLG